MMPHWNWVEMKSFHYSVRNLDEDLLEHSMMMWWLADAFVEVIEGMDDLKRD